MKTSACRDGTLKKPTKLDGNDTTTLSHHPYILCHFAATYTNMVCVLVVCRGLWKAVLWVVLGVYVDVHGEWVMLWVASMYNVLAVLSMADMDCLACMQKLWSP